MRLTRLVAAAAFAVATFAAPAADAAVCTIRWRPLLPPDAPVQVQVPYCVW